MVSFLTAQVPQHWQQVLLYPSQATLRLAANNIMAEKLSNPGLVIISHEKCLTRKTSLLASKQHKIIAIIIDVLSKGQRSKSTVNAHAYAPPSFKSWIRHCIAHHFFSALSWVHQQQHLLLYAHMHNLLVFSPPLFESLLPLCHRVVNRT